MVVTIPTDGASTTIPTPWVRLQTDVGVGQESFIVPADLVPETIYKCWSFLYEATVDSEVITFTIEGSSTVDPGITGSISITAAYTGRRLGDMPEV